MSTMDDGDELLPQEPELIVLPGGGGRPVPGELDHLAENRRFIVRRALLATAVGGAIPLPVMDEYLSGRVKAGMLMKLAERRQVDLASSSAELLGDPRGTTALRNATLTAATLLALKLAWRKFFALLAVGRRAEEMASTFQLGTLFDHYCAKMHVGAGIDRERAARLRDVIHVALTEAERDAIVSAFRDGSRVLSQTLLEAPAWANERIERAARRWAASGGRSTDADPSADLGEEDAEARWLDRAAGEVEGRLGTLGQDYLVKLVRTFERRFREAERQREAEPAKDAERQDAKKTPPGPEGVTPSSPKEP